MNADMISCGKAVCRVLGRAVTAKASDTPLPPPDAARLFCKAHGLLALFASAVSLRLPSDNTYQPLVINGLALTAAQMKTDAAESALSRRFTDAGIRHVVLKGSHTRSFYPPALVRPSADIDWYIAPADAQSADEQLLADGWTLKRAAANERCYEKRPHACLELHLSPDGFDRSQQRTVKAMLDRAVVADGLRCQLTDEDACAYALFHLYKHFVLAGAGVRMFLDVFVLETNAAPDISAVDRTLDALGCAGFAKRVRQINAVLFDDAEPDDDLDTLIRFVFASGAYGIKSAQLALEPVNNTVTHRTKLGRLMRNYCLDLPSMRHRYPCLKRAAWLYPCCVVHRLCHGWRFHRAAFRKATADHKDGREHRDDLRRILQLASIL